MKKSLTALLLITSLAGNVQAQQINYTWNGSNGSGGLNEYGIVTQASSGQATLGAEANGDLYANLNLGSTISGTRRLWHISKRSSTENHNLNFYYFDGTTFKNNLTLATNGYVGIGTITPDGLQVNSTLSQETSRGVTNVRLGVFGNTPTPRIIFDQAGQIPFLVDNSQGKLRIYTPGEEKLVIKSNGNVGIGSTNPDSKLTVKGKIHAEEVLVDMDVPGPDYVFEKDYNLLPLAEIEAYINENKHLPEVPSAKAMEANGLNLKEMNLILLKKVEELTLHLIEQQKELGRQKQEIENLKKKR